MSEKWKAATVKLECSCTFGIPPTSYEDWWPQKEATCSTHGPQRVLRVSRLGTK